MRPLLLSCLSLHVLACASAAPRPAANGLERAAVNGTEVAYVAEGSGPTVLIVHGAFSDYRSFARTAAVLAHKSTVVRASLRLHWPNPPPASEQEAYETYSVETHAADMIALIEKLGRSPVDLIGHSYGGMVAALVAKTRPDLVRRLILAEPSLAAIVAATPEREKSRREELEWDDAQAAKIRAGGDPLAVVRGVYDEDRPGTFDSFPEIRRRILTDNARTAGPFFASNWGFKFPYSCDDARSLTMPVLLVEGEKTGSEMREVISMLLGCMTNARRVVLPDSGHTFQFDAPEAFGAAVAAFLESP